MEHVLLTNAVVTRESLLEFSEEIMPHVSSPASSKALRAAAA
ncbi:MAG: hypothetical protein ACXWCY_23930 [Burkholderiales bacterium]